MRKLFLTCLCILFLNTFLLARDIIPLTTNLDNKQPIGHSYPKSPMCAPVVYIENYTLSFAANHPDYGMAIKNEDGEVVYTTVVTTTETQVILPPTLTGSYMIELTMGNWLFTGWIEL